MNLFISGFLFGFFGGMPIILFYLAHNKVTSREDSKRLAEELKRWRR